MLNCLVNALRIGLSKIPERKFRSSKFSAENTGPQYIHESLILIFSAVSLTVLKKYSLSLNSS